jgi:hypothetical protein
MTTAFKLLSLVWSNGKKDSWERINHAMRQALSLAIGSGLTFKAGDFEQMAAKFRWGYWVTDSTEWIYREAIINGNEACVKAYEEWRGRTAFHANNIGTNYCNSPFIHANSIERKRERAAVGMRFPMNERTWYVTGFNDEAGTIRLASYASGRQEGKPEKLLQLTNDEFRAFHPSPKKAKKKDQQP